MMAQTIGSPRELRHFTATFPMPPDVLWPNQAPGHWGEKTGQRASYRLVCRKQAEAVWGAQDTMRRAALSLLFVFCGHRRRDADNCLAAAKALIDALVDAGIVPTDSPRHITSVQVSTDRHTHAKTAPCAGGEVFVMVQELRA